MSDPNFSVRAGHSLDCGSWVITPSAGSLVGSTARMRIGRRGEPALVTLTSTSPPSVGAFVWNDSTGVLAVDLHQDTLAAIPRGSYVYEITIVKSSGVALAGPSGALVVSETIAP
jgi:hypothetical protein